ncbi:MAG: cytoplasmic protein [Acidobacteria bacterium]|nr:cytoplasmic protein [Acidobacteriota bacterium]
MKGHQDAPNTTWPGLESSRNYNLMLENDHVRVLEYRSHPGEKSEMHSHPACLVYSFNTATLLIITPYGISEEFELKPGELVWHGETTHAIQNIGQTDAHLLVIELKGLPGK